MVTLMANEIWARESSDWGRRMSKQRDEASNTAAAHEVEAMRRLLERTIEGEIIPRLMLVHSVLSRDLEASEGEHAPSREDVEELSRLLLRDEGSLARDFMDTLQHDGASLESIYLDVLTPAAKHLGELWVDDRCTWTEVSVGLSRLHTLLRSTSDAFHQAAERPAIPRGRVLLTLAPKEQHVFGLCLVDEFFRRRGWDVSLLLTPGRVELCKMLHEDYWDILGFSLSVDSQLEALHQVIEAARDASRNPELVIMVGGRTFQDHPEYVALAGADMTAKDAPEAVEMAEQVRDRPGHSG